MKYRNTASTTAGSAGPYYIRATWCTPLLQSIVKKCSDALIFPEGDQLQEDVIDSTPLIISIGSGGIVLVYLSSREFTISISPADSM